jgi:uncharacterized protein (TIGR03083 family)
MVLEISTAILGPLPLQRHPKSKPFTPCAVVPPGYGNAAPTGDAQAQTGGGRPWHSRPVAGPDPVDVADIPQLTHDEAMRLYARELRRGLDLISTLGPEDWTRQTDCPDWDVRELYLHVVGAMESGASRRELAHQFRVALLRRRTTGESLEAALSATQVEERRQLSPDELVRRFAEVAPRCIRARNAIPRVVREWVRFTVDAPVVEPWTLGYLVDVIYLRDAWMHRIDATRATGAAMVLTPEHDGTIVADVVREWAGRHGRPFHLELSGPAGGSYVGGGGGDVEHLELDAVDFCRALSGRAPAEDLLSTVVPF